MSEPFIGEIKMVGFNFPPKGWATCDGQIMSIAQNTALFSLLGTTYGGNGTTTFGLPDLRGRTPIGQGTSPLSGSPYVMGQSAGGENVSLTVQQIPPHSHTPNCNSGAGTSTASNGNFSAADSKNYQPYAGTGPAQMAPTAIANTGAGQGHNNMQPFLCVPFCIALVGIYPSRN
jgi:microcystin-dependent protein